MTITEIPNLTATILTESPAGGGIKWSAVDFDAKEKLALIDIRFACPGCEVACSEWFTKDALAEFRAALAAFAENRTSECKLDGLESGLRCAFSRRAARTTFAIYFEMQFNSADPVASDLLRTESPNGTSGRTAGAKCVESFDGLLALLGLVDEHL